MRATSDATHSEPVHVPASELGWVAEHLGLRLTVTEDVLGGRLDGMAGLALRRNPRRAHLLVSRLLGKHLPVDPHEALHTGALLAGRLPADVLAGEPLVFGFAETATALGHSVAAAVPGAVSVCSTRRSGVSVLTFEEEHSHATAHRVLAPLELISTPRAVVLVDDELSTGRTAINTIRALHAITPRPSYTVAALLDLRPASARAAFAALSEELGVPVHAVCLLSGELEVPADAVHAAAPLVASGDPPIRSCREYPVERVEATWPADLPLGGRTGWGPELEELLSTTLKPLAEAVASDLATLARPDASPRVGPRRVLVLGTEELMYVPMRLAAALAERLGSDGEVRTQSTTRSPVVPIDRDGYAVRCALAFPAPDEPERQSFVYNLSPAGGGGSSYDAIIVVCDPPACEADAAMLGALAGCAPVVQIQLPEVLW
ncbi:MAG TPA: phosphoribosyltransferase family protein [Frankiaceae bacterium]|nr:phosphoribosyltransferase family protein [Frankiaceae bacterium]